MRVSTICGVVLTLGVNIVMQGPQVDVGSQVKVSAAEVGLLKKGLRGPHTFVYGTVEQIHGDEVKIKLASTGLERTVPIGVAKYADPDAYKRNVKKDYTLWLKALQTDSAEIDPTSFPSGSNYTRNRNLKPDDIPDEDDNSLLIEGKMHDKRVNDTIFVPSAPASRWFTPASREMISTFANDLRVHCDPQAFRLRQRRFLYCYMAFLGEPGSGKTTIMKYTAHQIYQNFLDDEIVCMWITPGINASAYQHSGTAFLQALLRKLNQLANDPKIKVCVLCLEELMCSLGNAGHHTMDGGEVSSYLEILEFKHPDMMYVVLAATTWEEFLKAQRRFTRRFTTQVILDSYGVADAFKFLHYTADQLGCVLEGCTSEWHEFLQKLSHPLKRANWLDQAVELAANKKQSGFKLEAAKEIDDYMELTISDVKEQFDQFQTISDAKEQFDKFQQRHANSTLQEPDFDMMEPTKKRRKQRYGL